MIDEQVAGNREVKGFTGRESFVRSLVNAHIDLLAEVVDVVFVDANYSAGSASKRLPTQYFPNKPIVHPAPFAATPDRQVDSLESVSGPAIPSASRLSIVLSEPYTYLTKPDPANLEKPIKIVRKREEC